MYARVELTLLRPTAILDDYRPDCQFGATWFGAPSRHDGTVRLGAPLAPSATCIARVVPRDPTLWWCVELGDAMSAWEGERVVAIARVLAWCEVPADFTRSTARFASEAMQLCDFVERAHECALPLRLANARDRLLALYAAASGLPDAFADGPDVDATRPRTWPGFGAHEYYVEIVDPYALESPQRGAGDLSDDLLDVYGEVKAGLLLWQRPDVPRAAAIWMWRHGFQVHWGAHATSAIRALHHACRASE